MASSNGKPWASRWCYETILQMRATCVQGSRPKTLDQLVLADLVTFVQFSFQFRI